MNLLLMIDSYKAGHARLYPRDLTNLYCYVESRGGRFPATIFFGLQYYLRRYLQHGVSLADVDEAEAFWTAHFGRDDYFDAASWRRLVAKHGKRLPLRIRAVPEGTLVPTGNVLMTIENTDPEFPFVSTFFETLLLKIWYPTTVATQSYFIRETIGHWYDVTGADRAGLDFACHDFGYRGVSSEETAGLGGAAHLLSFNGTDTVAGIRLLAEHYDGAMSGFSIPATEHSVIMAFRSEREAFEHVLDEFPTGVIACVSDTFNIFNAVETLWGTDLRDRVLQRDGRLVVRPDSGNPNEVVPKVLDLLRDRFGAERNERGYLTLNPHVRVIQGDGMNAETIGLLYSELEQHGYAADNLTVGAGGGLLQQVNRDTQKFAFKASYAEYATGEHRSIAKSPITDPGKHSKPGRLKLTKTGPSPAGLITISDTDALAYGSATDSLETVFENGELAPPQSLSEIRSRVRATG